MEFAAKAMARKVCSVIKDNSKRSLCITLLTKVLVYGESVKNEVKEEFRKNFTEEERELIKKALAELG